MQSCKARDLLQRCAIDRDAETWQEFFNRFDRRIAVGVYRTLAKFDARIGSEDRQDLLQEVYCRLLERRGRYLRRCRGEFDGAVGAYLGRVAESVVVDYLRNLSAAKRGSARLGERRWDASLELAEWVADSNRSPEELLLRRERHTRFLCRCRDLVGSRSPKRDLEVLYLAFFQGWTSREISSRIGNGLTPSAVDSLVHRMKKRLARAGIEVPRRRSVRAPVVDLDR